MVAILWICLPEMVSLGSSSCTLAGLSFLFASGSYKSHSLLPSGCWCIKRKSLSALFSSLTSASCLFSSIHAILSFLSASAAKIQTHNIVYLCINLNMPPMSGSALMFCNDDWDFLCCIFIWLTECFRSPPFLLFNLVSVFNLLFQSFQVYL